MRDGRPFRSGILVAAMLLLTVSGANARQFENCSGEDSGLVLRRQYTAVTMADYTLGKLQERLDSGNYIPTAIVQMKRAKSVLQCAKKILDDVNYSCHAQTTLCSVEGTNAHVWPYSNTIYVCDHFWKSDARPAYLAADQVGTILHEATHYCGTIDVTYFGVGNPPKDTWNVAWSSIASTYDYWAQIKFCIPGDDC